MSTFSVQSQAIDLTHNRAHQIWIKIWIWRNTQWIGGSSPDPDLAGSEFSI